MIAMAMSCEPALLICDEPTTALDVTVQQKILVLLKELQQANGMGILFITHDLGLVASFADRVAVMYKGRVVENNNTHTLFNNPQHPYTKALLACRPALHPKGEKLPVVSDFMEQDVNGNIIEKTRPAAVSSIPQTLVSADQSPLVAVKDLHIWYPTRKNLLGKPLEWMKAVNGVSFDVYPGETLGLVGESGCGKTTLGRAILGLTPIQSGHILYKGVPVSQQDRKTWLPLRREMQLIFQDPYASLNPRIRIGPAIAEPLLVHGLARNAAEAREQVIELLEKVNLQADHYHRFPHEFSGGQRQRIVIARALALKPSFVVCDESVAALDVSVQAQVLNLLNELKQDFGFTALFISHDLSVVRYLSDRIIVMQKGQIVESGDPQSIYTRPANPYTRELIDAIPGTPDSR
jgi:peptide/nickel transport system ATP-binding protein